jgi:hypothetical protein
MVAMTRALVAALVATAFVAGVALAGPAATIDTVDKGLCTFPLEISTSRPSFSGPVTITLRNGKTGRTATLHGSGERDGQNGISFSGHRIWVSALAHGVPFLSTDGAGNLKLPYDALHGTTNPQAIDPCALVGPPKLTVAPRAAKLPWRLPGYELTRIAQAHLAPIVGALVRHDHVHLDVIVNGKPVKIPAGVGLVQPAPGQSCHGSVPTGDCRAGGLVTFLVAAAPVHTHSASGIIHIESDRAGRFTLGQFFDLWGVRLTSDCVGAYCAGGGNELRVYVDGRRAAGDPRDVALTSLQEIAVVYGKPGATRVPTRYAGGWPGRGCGGASEPSCLPPGA